jgi:hypothetical protein
MIRGFDPISLAFPSLPLGGGPRVVGLHVASVMCDVVS